MTLEEIRRAADQVTHLAGRTVAYLDSIKAIAARAHGASTETASVLQQLADELLSKTQAAAAEAETIGALMVARKP